ncbi:hypothetical protein ACQPW3_11330 [Actinosynnema sp. CA-248983]
MLGSRRRERAALVGALASYLRVESEADAGRVRAALPDPGGDRAAVSAALAAYREVTGGARDPLSSRAPLNLGVYLADRAPDTASEVLREVVAGGLPEHAAEAAAWLGVVLDRLGDVAGAEQAFRAAADSSHPFHGPRSLVNLGEFLLRLGDFAAARAALRRAIDSGHPFHGPRARVALAGLMIYEGDVAGARAIYEDVRRSDHPEIARLARDRLALLESGTVLPDGERAKVVAAQLIRLPRWYLTRDLLHANADLLPEVEDLLRGTEAAAPLVRLVTLVREVGVDEALAGVAGLYPAVPTRLRLLALQTVEAADWAVNDGGAPAVADAEAAHTALLTDPEWPAVDPAVRLAVLDDLAAAWRQVFTTTAEVEHLDRLIAVTEQVEAIAAATGLADPAVPAATRAQLVEVRERARHGTALIRFALAIETGEAAAVLAEHPDLLADTDRLRSIVDGDEALQQAVVVLSLCREVGPDIALRTVGPAGDHLIELLRGVTGHPDDIRRQLNAHPELLDDAADIMLGRLIESADPSLPAEGVADLRAMRELLRRAREAGVDTAVAEAHSEHSRDRADHSRRGALAMHELIGAPDEAAARAVITRHADVLLDDATDDTLTEMIAGDRPDLAAAARSIRDLLRGHRVFGPDPDGWIQFTEFMTLPDPPDATLRRLLAACPGLLLPVADDLLADLAADGPDELVDVVRRRRDLLRRCRELGVAAAVDAAWHDGHLLPSDLTETVTRALTASLRLLDGDMDSRAEVEAAWESIERHPALHDRPRPALLGEQLATADLFRHRLFQAPGALDRAVDALRDSIAHTHDDHPGLTQRRRFLADALLDRFQRHNDPADLREATGLAAALADDPSLDQANLLGGLLLRSYDRLSTRPTLDRAVAVLETAARTEATPDLRAPPPT